MRFLVYAIIALAVALSSLAALAQTRPAPTLRPAAPNEIPNREWTAKMNFLRAKFPGAVHVPNECTWIRIDPNKPPTMYNYKLLCSEMRIPEP